MGVPLPKAPDAFTVSMGLERELPCGASTEGRGQLQGGALNGMAARIGEGAGGREGAGLESLLLMKRRLPLTPAAWVLVLL